MEDEKIVELYNSRDESAISETARKYGNYLFSISFHILSSREDAEECVSDTYRGAWNAIPPHCPAVLSAFLGKLTRRISIDRWRRRSADKRGGGQTALALDELADCVSGDGEVTDELERRELAKEISLFLSELPDTERRVFLRRYFYLDSVREIAEKFGFSKSRVSSMLFRTRKKLRERLEKGGYEG